MRTPGRFALAAGILLAQAACDSSASAPDEAGATLIVAVATAGGDPDRDGYTVLLDNAAAGQVDAIGQVSLRTKPGPHTVELAGLAANCQASGALRASVDVAAGAISTVSFSVSCPASSSLLVRVRTVGDVPDPDGYTWEIAGTTGTLGVADSVSVSGIPSGTYDIVLGDVAPNCHQSADQAPIELGPRASDRANLTVLCMPDDAGWMVFTVRDPPGTFEIWSMEANGAAQARVTTGGQAYEPAISPDGKRIAFDSDGILVMNADGTGLQRLTSAGSAPGWSPDGGSIVYSRNRSLSDRIADIFVVPAGGGPETNLTNLAGIRDVDPAWAPDGSRIVFSSRRDGSNGDLFVMDADGGNVRALTTGMISASDPDWSPEGTRILFSGAFDANLASWGVFVVNADGTGLRTLAGSSGSYFNYPAWSPDGKWITFASTRGGQRTDVYVMREDGSDIVRLTRMGALWADTPSWGRR